MGIEAAGDSTGEVDSLLSGVTAPSGEGVGVVTGSLSPGVSVGSVGALEGS